MHTEGVVDFIWINVFQLNLYTCGQILDRESKRERILEARMREIRLKLRQAEEGSLPVIASEAELAAVGDRDLADASAEYMQTVKKELTAMQLKLWQDRTGRQAFL